MKQPAKAAVNALPTPTSYYSEHYRVSILDMSFSLNLHFLFQRFTFLICEKQAQYVLVMGNEYFSGRQIAGQYLIITGWHTHIHTHTHMLTICQIYQLIQTLGIPEYKSV